MDILIWAGVVAGHFIAGALAYRLFHKLVEPNKTPDVVLFTFFTVCGYMSLTSVVSGITLFLIFTGFRLFLKILKKIAGVS